MTTRVQIAGFGSSEFYKLFSLQKLEVLSDRKAERERQVFGNMGREKAGMEKGTLGKVMIGYRLRCFAMLRQQQCACVGDELMRNAESFGALFGSTVLYRGVGELGIGDAQWA